VLSQRIQFSSQEFGDITWGLFLFGNVLVLKIKDYGLANGFIKKENNA